MLNNKLSTGHKENYFFRFTVDYSQTVKVDNVGGTILNWLQRESENSQ